jgi:hypothetical protein
VVVKKHPIFTVWGKGTRELIRHLSGLSASSRPCYDNNAAPPHDRHDFLPHLVSRQPLAIREHRLVTSGIPRVQQALELHRGVLPAVVGFGFRNEGFWVMGVWSLGSSRWRCAAPYRGTKKKNEKNQTKKQQNPQSTCKQKKTLSVSHSLIGGGLPLFLELRGPPTPPRGRCGCDLRPK